MSQALQLVDFKGSPSLNEDTLNAVLRNPICRDRPVVVVSIAGDYRKGKSFMLNMFLKYLTFASQGKNDESDADWLSDGEKPFEGFTSRGGLKRETTGILIWPEPILITLPTGEKVAVLVLDTQGTFDSQSTAAENSQIFALSTMISSIQVYNQFNNIQENDLQQLSLFVEYGAKALGVRMPKTGVAKSTMTAPFQKLVLLVRDWRFEEDFTCDEAGSKRYLEDFLEVTSDQATELQVVRKQLKKCFKELDCFLLPQPGPVVEKGKPLQCMAALSDDFRRELRRFVPTLFSPDCLSAKSSSGRRLTGAQLADYIRTYCEVLFSGGIPCPTSLWRATAEVDHRLAVEEALVGFQRKMNAVLGGEQPMDSDELSGRIILHKREAMITYANAPKMEDPDVKAEFSDQLILKLGDSALSYLKLNRTRRERRVAEARAAKEEEARKMAEQAAYQERVDASRREQGIRLEQKEQMEKMRTMQAAELARRDAEQRATRAETRNSAMMATLFAIMMKSRSREEENRREQREEMDSLKRKNEETVAEVQASEEFAQRLPKTRAANEEARNVPKLATSNKQAEARKRK